MTNHDPKEPKVEFPCEKEKLPIELDRYQVLLEFVKGVSSPEEDIDDLIRQSNLVPEDCDAGWDECFYSGAVKNQAEIALCAREVLKQIGEPEC